MHYKKMTAVLIAVALASSAALGGCGNKIDSDAVVATIGDQEISLGYANFVARYTQISYDSIFVSYYGEDYWTNEAYSSDDGNMEDTVKGYVMDEIELQYLMEAHMDDYGVEITDDDMADIKAAAEEFMSDNSKEAIKALGATQDYVETMLYYSTVESRMSEAIEAEAEADADEQLSIDDYSRRTFSYVEIDLSGYTDDDGNEAEYTDDELDALADEAQAFAEEAQADYDGAADSYGYTVSSYSYGDDEDSEEDGGFSDAVIAAADEMAEGDVSGVIEGTDAYYIIRLDSEDDADAAEEAYESAVSDLASQLYDDVTDGYADESDFEVDEDLWATVSFAELFTVDIPEDDESSTAE